MQSKNNQQKKEEVHREIDKFFQKFLRKGFYGDASLQIMIHDGAIQDIRKHSTESIKIWQRRVSEELSERYQEEPARRKLQVGFSYGVFDVA